MPSPGIRRRVILVRTHISEGRVAFIIRVEGITALGRSAVTYNSRRLQSSNVCMSSLFIEENCVRF
jgi:hypothetical protein